MSFISLYARNACKWDSMIRAVKTQSWSKCVDMKIFLYKYKKGGGKLLQRCVWCFVYYHSLNNLNLLYFVLFFSHEIIYLHGDSSSFTDSKVSILAGPNQHCGANFLNPAGRITIICRLKTKVCKNTVPCSAIWPFSTPQTLLDCFLKDG